MPDTDLWIIHTDGGARGNPGPAAFAYTIALPDGEVVEGSGCIGTNTNNVAEYTALVHALERAKELGGRRLHVHSDSELMVKQMRGEYQVKHDGLKPLFTKARALAKHFDEVRFTHIRRELNKRADDLYNAVLDGEAGGKHPSAGKAKVAKAHPDRIAQVRAEAITCLRSVASAWARGNSKDPAPEHVWEQLWTILEESGVLRPAKKP